MDYDAERAVAEFRRFATEHGLSYAEATQAPDLPRAPTDSRGPAYGIVAGRLPGGITGLIADISYATKEDGQPVERHSHLLLTRVPETIGFIPRLFCGDATVHGLAERIIGPGGLLKVFRSVELESIKFNARYRVGVDRYQDENWIRQLFDPVFIDWLAEHAPQGCFFQLFEGVLSASSSEEPGTPGALDRLCAFASAVAERLRGEVSEQDGLPLAPPSAEALQARQHAQERLDRSVAEVRFDSPPADVRSAAKRYRGPASRRPLGWIVALAMPVVVFALPIGLLVLFLVATFRLTASAALILAGVLFAAGFAWMVPRLLRSMVRHQSVQSGAEAFLRGYAASRGLSSVDPARYHAEHPHLRLPGMANHVLEGALPGAVGHGYLLVCESQPGRRQQLLATRAATCSMAGSPEQLLISLTPRGTQPDTAALGGFLLEGVHELIRATEPPPATSGLDPRLRERFDVVVDEQTDPSLAREILSNGVVEQTLQDGKGASMGFTVQGPDVVVFEPDIALIEWTAEDLDGLCERLAHIRDHLSRVVGSAVSPT